MSPQNIQEYLLRIGNNRNPNPTVSFLKELHRQHLLNIPFENLSIHNNEKIILDTEKLFEKIVIKKRGGFCYELNGLFFDLLVSLGFKAKMISARVFNKEAIPGPEFDHMALIVNLEGSEFLCDVGFGELFLEPLKFILNEEQVDSRKHFQIIKINANDFKLTRLENKDERRDQYLFTTQSRELEDFKDMCNFHQTSQDSHFTQKQICSIAMPDGRITLSGDKLILTKDGKKEEIFLRNKDEFSKYLKTYFKISLL